MYKLYHIVATLFISCCAFIILCVTPLLHWNGSDQLPQYASQVVYSLFLRESACWTKSTWFLYSRVHARCLVRTAPVYSHFVYVTMKTKQKKVIKPLYNHVWFCGGLVFARLTGCILPLPLFMLPQSLTYICPAVLCVQWKELTFSTLWSGPQKANFPSAASSGDNKTLTGRSDLTKNKQPPPY